MKVAIVGVGSFELSAVKKMLNEMGHEDVVIVEPENLKEVNLSDLKIPEEIQPSLIKSLNLDKYEKSEYQERFYDDIYEKRQKKMRRNHYRHMKHRI